MPSCCKCGECCSKLWVRGSATESVEDAAAIAVDSCPDMLLMDNSYPRSEPRASGGADYEDCPGHVAVVLSPLFRGRRPTPAASITSSHGTTAPMPNLRTNVQELFASQGDGTPLHGGNVTSPATRLHISHHASRPRNPGPGTISPFAARPARAVWTDVRCSPR